MQACPWQDAKTLRQWHGAFLTAELASKNTVGHRWSDLSSDENLGAFKVSRLLGSAFSGLDNVRVIEVQQSYTGLNIALFPDTAVARLAALVRRTLVYLYGLRTVGLRRVPWNQYPLVQSIESRCSKRLSNWARGLK